MPVRKTRASELATQVLKAKSAWEDTKLRLEQAKTEHEYAQKLLVLKRQELSLEMGRMAPDDDWQYEVTQGFGYPEEVLNELTSVELVGEPIGRAARSSLVRLRHATPERLAGHMVARGFQFATDVPARELHGALVKQPWAKKDKKTDEWEYREGE